MYNPSPLIPGVTSLRVLLAREKDEDSPRLHILLTECLFAVYVSLLINALATYDCFLLYRLMAHKFDTQMWSSLFGGGVKTVVKLGSTSPRLGSKYKTELVSQKVSFNLNLNYKKILFIIPILNYAYKLFQMLSYFITLLSMQKKGVTVVIGCAAGKTDDLYNKRMQLNMKIMGQQKDGKKTYKEQFVPPELSMITFFMTKPFVENLDADFHYDSDDSVSDEEEDMDSEEEMEEDLNRPTSMYVSRSHLGWGWGGGFMGVMFFSSTP